jgi:putative ABC transport system permease protein
MLTAAQAFLLAIAWIVPGDARADWLEEWRAELDWHVADRRGVRGLGWTARLGLTWRLPGAVVHALWLRKQQWSVDMLWQDVRFGLRILLRRPAFTLMAILTLAIGIGATTAIFSVVHGVLLKPLPYREPARLVQVWETNPLRDWTEANVAPANLLDWKARNHVFEDVAFYVGSDTREAGFTSQTLAGAGDAEHVSSLRVSPNFFTVLGVAPSLGRTFRAEEATPGRHRVVILSHDFWQRRFAGDASIVGSRVRLGAFDYEVAGVMPAAFRFGAGHVDLWQPLAYDVADFQTTRQAHMLRVVARLKPGVSLERARAEMTAIAAALEREYPDTNTKMGVGLGPLDDWFVGGVRTPLIVFLAAVAFLLLIACSNVANLMLAQAVGRRREMAVRTALGAGRLRLVQQLMTESVLLSIAGGALGLLCARWGVDAFLALSPPNLPRLNDVRVDIPVLIFSAALTSATAFAFGLIPALHVAGMNRSAAVAGGRGTTSRGRATRRLLVAAQVALAFVLVVGAALMMRSLVRLERVSPGIDTSHLLTARITLHSGYDDDEKAVAFFDRAVDAVSAIPGVRAAGAATRLALDGATWTGDLSVEGRPEVWGRELRHKTVVPGYFDAVGLPLVGGHDFSAFDTPKAPSVVIVNQALRRAFFGGQNPVGHRISYTKPSRPPRWRTIVGVVADEKQDGLASATRPEAYDALRQSPENDMTIVVRTSGDPGALGALVRHAVRGVDPTVALYDVKTMEARLGASVARERLSGWLLTAFGAVALLLAAVGVYAVVAFSIRNRLREIGVRLALGATRRDILWLGLLDGMTPAAIGVGIGFALALGLTRLVSSLLFDTTPTDPLTYAVAAVALVGVALLASYLPARRATRVDPVTVLRAE